MIYGKDEDRKSWFSPEETKDRAEFIMPMSKIPISSTMLREFMAKDNQEEWTKWVSPNIYTMYDRLRTELLEVPFYANIYNKH